jgi:hypothetical protein
LYLYAIKVLARQFQSKAFSTKWTPPSRPRLACFGAFTFREGRASRLINKTAADQLAEPHDWACSRSAIIARAKTAAPPPARTLQLGNETLLQFSPRRRPCATPDPLAPPPSL